MNNANELVKQLARIMEHNNIVPIMRTDSNGTEHVSYDCLPILLVKAGGGNMDLSCVRSLGGCKLCPLGMKQGTWEETLNEIKLEELLDE